MAPSNEVARRKVEAAVSRPAEDNRSFMFENATILFRNFAGKEGQYNNEGDRNFCLLLSPQEADGLLEQGWNIKYLKPREEGDEPQPYVQVSLKYRNRMGQPTRPPRVVLINSRGRTDIPEEMLEILDWVDIANVDLIVNPYQWAAAGKTGVKAYLKSIWITIQEDELERKYADVPEIDSAKSALTYTKEITDGEDDTIYVEYEDVAPVEGNAYDNDTPF